MRCLGVSAFVALVLLSVSQMPVSAEATIRSEQNDRSTPESLPDLSSSWQGWDVQYDRFPRGNDTHTLFKWKAHNWSGIGHRDAFYQWATMITPQFYVTAWHTADPNSLFTYRFYGGNSVSANTDISAESNGDNEQIGTLDLALGRLGQDIPHSYQYYPVYRRAPVANVNPYGLWNDDFVMVGQSASPDFSTPTDPDNETDPFTCTIYDTGNSFFDTDPRSQKFGTNKAVSFIEGRNDRVIQFAFEDTNNPDEMAFRQNSSGGPSFKLVPPHVGSIQKPVLAGVHWSVARYTSAAYDADDFSCATKTPPGLLQTGRVARHLGLALDDTIFKTLTGNPLPSYGDSPLASTNTMQDSALGGYSTELSSSVSNSQTGASHLKDRIVFYTMNTANQLIKGDFNGNLARDADDLDILTREANMRLTLDRAYNWYLDWDGDGDIDQADVKKVMQDANAFNTKYGDLNADGNYTTAEQNEFFTHLNQAGKSWATGDFNGDGNCDNADFLLILETF